MENTINTQTQAGTETPEEGPMDVRSGGRLLTQLIAINGERLGTF